MKKILIINANYYNNITLQLLNASKKILKRNKCNLNLISVTGAFEIPVAIRKYINKYDAFVALGCIIKGNTPHFDLICKSIFNSISLLSITYNKPIGNGIITANNIKQAKERCGIMKSGKPNKGAEAANAVLSILNNGPKKI